MKKLALTVAFAVAALPGLAQAPSQRPDPATPGAEPGQSDQSGKDGTNSKSKKDRKQKKDSQGDSGAADRSAGDPDQPSKDNPNGSKRQSPTPEQTPDTNPAPPRK